MPTKTLAKKSSKSRKPAVKKKTATAVAKPAAKRARKAAAPPAGPAHKRGFMWKLLEQKKAQQKAVNGGKPLTSANPFERIHPQEANGFSRYNGPRRRAP